MSTASVIARVHEIAETYDRRRRDVETDGSISDEVSVFYGRQAALRLVGDLSHGEILLDEFKESVDEIISTGRNPAYQAAFVQTLRKATALLVD